eukprot:2150590-Rhodomonas_salina.4
MAYAGRDAVLLWRMLRSVRYWHSRMLGGLGYWHSVCWETCGRGIAYAGICAVAYGGTLCSHTVYASVRY